MALGAVAGLGALATALALPGEGGTSPTMANIDAEFTKLVGNLDALEGARLAAPVVFAHRFN